MIPFRNAYYYNNYNTDHGHVKNLIKTKKQAIALHLGLFKT